MADTKFSQFTNGGEMKVTDQVVGLRAGENTRFSFPGSGIKDAAGNYLFKYDTVGAGAVNYLTFTNSLTAASPVLGANGTATDVGIDIDLKGAGLLTVNNTTGINAIINDSTMVASTATNLNSALATKTYIDNAVSGSSPLTTKGDLYTFTTVDARLAVGSTNGQILQVDSGAATGLAWSTATFASTYAQNTILYAGTANTVTGLAAGTRAVLTANASNVPSWVSLTDGQLIIGSTAGAPAAASLIAGANITITPGSNSITIASSGAGTVNAGTANQIAYYATTGTAISGLTGGNGTVLVTNNTGVPSMLANPSATGRALLSVSGDAPAWSTATYPSTTTINQILYSSSNNVVAGITAAQGGVLVSDSSNIPLWLANPVANNRVLLSASGDLPAWSGYEFPALVGSSGTVLRSNGTNWAASTATFANTYSVSTLLYASSANAVSGLATANSSALVTNSTGVPAWSSTMTNGQVIIGSTGATPTAATLTPGTGISIANAAGSITISATGGGFGVATISGTSQAAAVNTMYIALNAGQTTLTLPGTYSVGDSIILVGSTANTGGWIVATAAGDTIRVNNATTSAGGTVTSSAVAGQTIELVCDVANTSWVMVDTVSVTLTTS